MINSKHSAYGALIGISAIFLTPLLAMAECTVSHIECTYECIEYYPNKTDCKKSKKTCVRVCDDFDVHISGPTPHGTVKSQAVGRADEKTKESIIVFGSLERIAAIGGETTGWAVDLDREIVLAKILKFKSIEIDPTGHDVEAFEGKKVKVHGIIVWYSSTERGLYPVLVITSIGSKASQKKK